MAFGNFSSDVVAKMRRLQTQMKANREERADMSKIALRTGITGTTAFALAFMNGRSDTGMWNLHGIPVDLVVSAAAHGIGLSGILPATRDRDQTYLAHAMGDGALACGLARMATSMGQKSLEKKKEQGQGQGHTTKGELTSGEQAGALPPSRYAHGYPAERWTVRRAA